ncbi:MAG TPA: hypothetical protein VGU20_27730 [Stellaceae bacterium]|nr:hypothetical protein [Stellaceae bacterium]
MEPRSLDTAAAPAELSPADERKQLARERSKKLKGIVVLPGDFFELGMSKAELSALFTYLRHDMRNDGLVWPLDQFVADLIDVDRATVVRADHALMERGFLEHLDRKMAEEFLTARGVRAPRGKVKFRRIAERFRVTQNSARPARSAEGRQRSIPLPIASSDSQQKKSDKKSQFRAPTPQPEVTLPHGKSDEKSHRIGVSKNRNPSTTTEPAAARAREAAAVESARNSLSLRRAPRAGTNYADPQVRKQSRVQLVTRYVNSSKSDHEALAFGTAMLGFADLATAEQAAEAQRILDCYDREMRASGWDDRREARGDA